MRKGINLHLVLRFKSQHKDSILLKLGILWLQRYLRSVQIIYYRLKKRVLWIKFKSLIPCKLRLSKSKSNNTFILIPIICLHNLQRAILVESKGSKVLQLLFQVKVLKTSLSKDANWVKEQTLSFKRLWKPYINHPLVKWEEELPEEDSVIMIKL